MKNLIAILAISASMSAFGQTSPTKPTVELAAQTPEQWNAQVKDLEKKISVLRVELKIDDTYQQYVQLQNDLATAKMQATASHDVKDQKDQEEKRKAAHAKADAIAKARGLQQ